MKRYIHFDTIPQGSCWNALLAADMLCQNETLYFRIAREYLLAYAFRMACRSGLSHIIYMYTYMHTWIQIYMHACIHTQECPSHNFSHNLNHEYKGCWSISYQSHNFSQNKPYIYAYIYIHAHTHTHTQVSALLPWISHHRHARLRAWQSGDWWLCERCEACDNCWPLTTQLLSWHACFTSCWHAYNCRALTTQFT